MVWQIQVCDDVEFDDATGNISWRGNPVAIAKMNNENNTLRIELHEDTLIFSTGETIGWFNMRHIDMNQIKLTAGTFILQYQLNRCVIQGTQSGPEVEISIKEKKEIETNKAIVGVPENNKVKWRIKRFDDIF